MTEDAIEVLLLTREPRQERRLRAALRAIAVPVHTCELNQLANVIAIADTVQPDLIIIEATSLEVPIAQGVAAIRDQPSCAIVPLLLIAPISETSEAVDDWIKAGVTDVLPELDHAALLHARLSVFVNLVTMQRLLTSRTRLVERQVLSAVGPTHDREVEALQRLAAMIEVHKCGTQTHHADIEAMYVRIIAESLGMSEAEVDVLELAAPLHDIGEIAISDTLLQKPGKLTHDERAKLSRHPQVGHDLLKTEHSKYLQMASEIALHHHERYDGSGYPNGVAAEAIPLSARIVAVASVFVALTSSRPFRRKGWSVRRASNYLQAEAGKCFDPAVVAAFTAHLAGAHTLN